MLLELKLPFKSKMYPCAAGRLNGLVEKKQKIGTGLPSVRMQHNFNASNHLLGNQLARARPIFLLIRLFQQPLDACGIIG